MIEGITIGEFSGLLVFIVGLVTAVNYLTSPFRKYKNELDDLKNRQDLLEKESADIHDFMYVSLVAIKALLKHGVDGNDVESMRSASRDVESYLNKKVKQH